MTQPNSKRVRATSFVNALRMCKEFALKKHRLTVERIADNMGATHDSLYKWLATGRMPGILLPAFELACGCNYASEWLASSGNRLVVPIPKGRKATDADLLETNSSWANALQLLTNFYANPSDEGKEATIAALQEHMSQVAFHQGNVAQFANPELDFEAEA